jgi:Reverse transcriptase (RNA-dependent DNA polymerase)
MVNTVFENQIGRNVEAYIDDMLVKSMMKRKHIEDLDETFETMHKVGMKLNLKKSFFGLAGEKFLGFMISKRGIEIYPSKSKSILDMAIPKKSQGIIVFDKKVRSIKQIHYKIWISVLNFL